MANEIEMAEQQLTGYAHAKAGYGIEALADGMGLTAAEWDEIINRGIVRLDDCDAEAMASKMDRQRRRLDGKSGDLLETTRTFRRGRS